MSNMMNNKNKQIHQQLITLFKTMGEELFTHYGLTFSSQSLHAPEQLPDFTYMSALSASGDGIKILSFIVFNQTTAQAIFPGRPETANEESFKDLCGELNNQLVGKVKNKLLAHDCRLALGLPTQVTGTQLTNSTVAGADEINFQFDSAHGQVHVKMFSLIHNDFTMLSTPDEALTGASEEGFLSFF